MNLVIRPAIVYALMNEPEREARNDRSRIYPSEAGGCARKAMLRIAGVKSEPFPLRPREAMNDGTVYEDSTFKLLEKFYGEGKVLPQLVLKNEFWSGKSDFVIGHGTDHPIIVEHKATGDKYWDNKNDPLPKHGHVIQLALYDRFYFEEFGIKPELRLYYRSWGKWAEFLLDVQKESIEIEGILSPDIQRKVSLPVNIDSLMFKMEWYYKNNKIPKRLPESKMDGNCTFAGRPSCGFYDYCWPKEKSLKEIKES